MTWRATPAGDAEGKSLNFGDTGLHGVAKGNVTFHNTCSYEVNVSQMRTSDPVFTLINTSLAAYSVMLPAAVLANDAWVNGAANSDLEFHPEALGPRTGQFLADTSEPSQTMIAIELRGSGVGPRIDVQPPEVLVGRVGYAPGESPKSFAERKLSISNKGTLPEPPNDALNLHLGSNLTGRYWSVRAVSGLLSELCVGTWNIANDTCSGTLPLDAYDPAVGIDATSTRILEVPLRVVPSTDGAKEWLITFFSNDSFMPEVVVRVTATGVSPPPVKVTCPAAVTVDANSQVPLRPTVNPIAGATCAWTVGSRPTTSNGTFSASASCLMTNYFADVAGTHVVTFSARDAQGDTSQCSTEITVKPKGDLWVELTWDKPNDIDLHLLHPGAGAATNPLSWTGQYDCYYGNKTPIWSALAAENPSLDRDDTVEKGPENTRINSPPNNVVYSIGAHYFSSKSSGAVKSTVKVYCDGVLVTTRTRLLTESQEKSMWLVGTVEYGAVAPCRFKLIDTVLARVNALAPERKP